MDELSSRKSSAALSFSRKASSGLVLRNSAEKRDRTTQVCSRVGCGSKMNSSKGHQIGCSGCSASLPTASSSLSLDRNRVMSRKRIGEAEGSLHTRGKRIIDPVPEDNDTSNRGISITSSRRTRNSNSTRDNDSKPVGIRRSAARAGLNEQDDMHRSRQMESSSAPRRLGTSRSNNNSNGILAAFDSSFDSSFLNAENVGHYMLLALDGIEQDEQPSYEQMLAMEANFLLSGLVFHDQHRDMRLDIDSMSYEELLALGESIGTVSTALAEEALEKCLTKSIYQATTTDEGTLLGEADDIKCCICQEEYEEGSKVGRLECQHQYHVECIQKWLQLKNWCPICKANAGPSSSP